MQKGPLGFVSSPPTASSGEEIEIAAGGKRYLARDRTQTKATQLSLSHSFPSLGKRVSKIMLLLLQNTKSCLLLSMCQSMNLHFVMKM